MKPYAGSYRGEKKIRGLGKRKRRDYFRAQSHSQLSYVMLNYFSCPNRYTYVIVNRSEMELLLN